MHLKRKDLHISRARSYWPVAARFLPGAIVCGGF
jgi:hypothetical protein